MRKLLLLQVFTICATLVVAQNVEYDLIPFLKANGRWTFAHAETMEIALKKDFQEVQLFKNGSAIVRENNKYGVIDKQGNVIISFKFNELYRHQDNFWAPHNALGQKAPQYKAFEISPGNKEKSIIFFPYAIESKRYPVFINKKTGYVDINNKVVIPPIFDYGSSFEGDYAEIWKNGQQGMIDTNGHVVIPTAYQELRYVPGEKFIYAKNSQSKVGYIDINGNVLIDFVYTSADYYFKFNYATVRSEDGKYGLIDRSGKTIIPLVYDGCFSVFRNRVVIKKNDYMGMIDLGQKTILPFEYDYIWNGDDYSYIIVSKDGKVGVMDHDLKLIIPYEYEYIQHIYTSDHPINKADMAIAKKIRNLV